MTTIRKAEERGTTSMGWLKSWHTFSFANYYDPRQMGFRSLRVINDDIFGPGGGFPKHPHEDMEIITVVLKGSLRHGDSLGHEQVLTADEVQRMSAGTGIRHSEFNASKTEPVHLLQIWIEPETEGVKPAYDQKVFAPKDRIGKLVRVAGRDRTEADGALRIHQDADLYLSVLKPRTELRHALRAGRAAWVHIATGAAAVNGQSLRAGDAVAVEDEAEVKISGDDGQVLVFDLA